MPFIDVLAFGRSGESPWWWLIILGGGVALYAWDRVRNPSRLRERSWGLFWEAAPWWAQAVYLAMAGGGTLYSLAKGHERWYWWFVPAVAWLAFAWVVVRRKPPFER